MRINAIPPTILFSVFFLLLASVFAQAKVTTTVRQTSEFSSTFSGDDGNDSSSEMGNFHALDGSDVTRGARGEITASNESTETESEMEVEAAESMEPEMAFPFGQASEAAVNMSFDGPRGRIVGGKEATVFVRRHLVLISIQDRSGNVYSCTGTILARKWVLSAAHCFDSVGSSEDVDEDETYVYISPRVLYPSFATRRFYIRNAFVHNGYAGNNYDLRNDIALVELWDTIPQSKYAPVRIGFEPRPRKTVLAAGYGVINEQGDEPRYAQQANLLSMDYGTCRRSEREEDRDFLERKTNVCAVSIGFPDKGLTDTCCKL